MVAVKHLSVTSTLPVSLYITYVGLGVLSPVCHHGGPGSILGNPCEICGGQMTLGNVFLRVRFSPACIITPVLHTHLHLRVAFTGRTKG
jgi:hypothetical protein